MIELGEMTQLDRIEAKLNYLMIKGYGWAEFQTTAEELNEWLVKPDSDA